YRLAHAAVLSLIPPYSPSFFFSFYGAHPDLPSFPTRRSSDLRRHRLGPDAPQVAAGEARRHRSADPFLGVEAGGEEVHRQRRRRSEEHTSELQSRGHLVCRLLLEKKKKTQEILEEQIHKVQIH